MGMEQTGPTREPHRHGAELSPAIHRVFDFFEEATKCQLVQLRLAMGLHDLGHGHAGIPQGSDDVIATAVLTPGSELVIDEPVVCASPGFG